ncbi:HD domain-containing phosphohydrolase [Methylophaga sp.]|uniref:HD domain-containing phosphohydrolase n=1 Tax=Methylophaga sp. TaxID=2024840 RepID=UPI003A948A5A
MAPHAQILIVDDVPDNIQVAMSLLREDSYEFSFANSGEKALSILQNDDAEFDLILLDIMMPGLDGYETCQRIKSQTQLKDIPIIFLTAKADVDSIARAFKVGGGDYVTKPFHAAELLARVRTHVQLYQTKKWLEQQNIDLETKSRFAQARLLSELENSQKELIWFLTELMESTSDETGKHIRRVAEISALLAKLHPTLTDTDADTLYHASPMHDIGKMTVPHEILHKPGKYTPEEFEMMKSHTTNAYKLLSGSKRKLIKSAAIIAYQHHEKWDGSGYPRGLKGSDIHIYGRIVALADVFDALTHQRCYKTAWTVDDAVAFIQEQRGFHFDPELVDLMISHLDQFADIVK